MELGILITRGFRAGATGISLFANVSSYHFDRCTLFLPRFLFFFQKHSFFLSFFFFSFQFRCSRSSSLNLSATLPFRFPTLFSHHLSDRVRTSVRFLLYFRIVASTCIETSVSSAFPFANSFRSRDTAFLNHPRSSSTIVPSFSQSFRPPFPFSWLSFLLFLYSLSLSLSSFLFYLFRFFS